MNVVNECGQTMRLIHLPLPENTGLPSHWQQKIATNLQKKPLFLRCVCEQRNNNHTKSGMQQ